MKNISSLLFIIDDEFKNSQDPSREMPDENFSYLKGQIS